MGLPAGDYYILVDGDDTYPAEHAVEMVEWVLEKNVDMVPVLWDVDPLDWRTDDPGEVVNRVLTNVDDGDIILFHDIYESSVVAALEVVDRLMERGYVFVTVDELLE